MAGTILTTITTLPVWTNKLCRTVSPNRSWWSQQWIRRIIHVTNWMAGPILTSSPHYFSAVKILLCLFSEKLAGSGYLAEQTKDPQITLPVWTNKLCTTSLREKDSIFYANRLVTSMYWVVKGAPRGPEWKTQAHMDHQRKSYKWGLGPVSMKASPQKGKPTHHQSKPKCLNDLIVIEALSLLLNIVAGSIH